MDVQNGVVDRFGAAAAPPWLAGLGRAVAAARQASVPVIYVRVAFRPGRPEISPRNRSFAALAQGATFAEDDPSTAVHPAIAPEPGDVTVVKKRVSAFSGSDLEVVLRSGDIETLVLTGVATSGVVLSTLREAADRDFGLVVLSDGCLDPDPEVHRVLTEKVFPRQAEVVTIDEWVGRLQAG